jgi:hypothetical protein
VGTGLTAAMSFHLGAVLPMAQWPAVNCLNNYADDLLVDPLRIEGGYARVPETPGLGVQVDEAALSRFRMDPPYELARPRLLLSVIWPGGRVRHYATIRQVWIQPDDGSKAWADLYARAEQAPVHDCT